MQATQPDTDGQALVPPTVETNGNSIIGNGHSGAIHEANGSSAVSQIKTKTSAIFSRFNGSSNSSIVIPDLPPKLAALVDGFTDSDQAKITEAEIGRLEHGVGLGEMQDIATEAELLRGYKKASWWTQFRILSGRAFKNLYRNPLLMGTHYVVAIVVACECLGSVLVSGLTFQFISLLRFLLLQSYQRHSWLPVSRGRACGKRHWIHPHYCSRRNRLGLFFFILSLFAFSCLSSLGVFANERLLFMRER